MKSSLQAAFTTRTIPCMCIRTAGVGFPDKGYNDYPSLLPFRPLADFIFGNVRLFKPRGAKTWVGFMGANMNYYYFLETQDSSNRTGSSALDFFEDRLDLELADIHMVEKHLETLPITSRSRTKKRMIFSFVDGDKTHVITVGKVGKDRAALGKALNEQFQNMISGKHYTMNFPGRGLPPAFNEEVDAIKFMDHEAITGAVMKLLLHYLPVRHSRTGRGIMNKDIVEMENGRGTLRTFYITCDMMDIDPTAVVKTVGDILRNRELAKMKAENA